MSSLLKLFYSSCSKWMLPATEGVGTDRLSVGKVQRRHQLVTFTNFSFYRSMSSVWHTKCGLLKSYLFYDVCGIMWRLNVMLKAVFVHQIQNLLNLSLESRKRKVYNKSGMRSCFQMSSFFQVRRNFRTCTWARTQCTPCGGVWRGTCSSCPIMWVSWLSSATSRCWS